MQCYVLCALVWCTVLSARQESFVIKKKRISTSKLKEDIGRKYGELLQVSSQLIAELSQLNIALVDRTGDLVSGDCCFVRSATKQELFEYRNVLNDFQKKMLHITTRTSQLKDILCRDQKMVFRTAKYDTIHSAVNKK